MPGNDSGPVEFTLGERATGGTKLAATIRFGQQSGYRVSKQSRRFGLDNESALSSVNQARGLAAGVHGGDDGKARGHVGDEL